MKLILKNCELIMQGLKRTEIDYVYNNKKCGVVYPGNFNSIGFCQSWIFPIEKGANYELEYIGSVTKDIGSVWLCALCKMDGDYVTNPQNGVGKEKIFSWNRDALSQGGKFTVDSLVDADCIVVTGLKDTHDSNKVIRLTKIG